KIGGLLARAGFTIANGGYGGTMTAAAKGSAEAGGKVIGVTCAAFRGKANKYISREITTKSLDERLETLIELGQAYIVLPGGTGTLLELAKVWELKNKGFLESEKPIILVGGFWKPLVELLKIDDPDSGRFVIQADEPEQIVQLLSDNL
ncbi:MAG: LOG family protein, partial [Sedimentisphaerales bacterium]|nr:LOG family protein [Sedimentisphaerales bacterium]